MEWLSSMDVTSSRCQISVIIPTYNRSPFLRQALESVLSQSYSPLEVIVVDDGSSTNYGKVIVDALKDQRIRYIRHDINRGGSAARNTGIRAAQGQWLAFLDDDDEWLPDRLQSQVDLLAAASTKIGVVYGGYEYYSRNQRKLLRRVYPKWQGDIFSHMLGGCRVGIQTVLVRKDCFSVAGLFDESLPGCQDWDVLLRLARHFEFIYVNKILARLHLHGHQMSANLSQRLIARKMFLDKHAESFSHEPSVYADLLNHYGMLTVIAGQWKLARQTFKRAIRVKPRQVRVYGRLLLTYGAPRLYQQVLMKKQGQYYGDVIFY